MLRFLGFLALAMLLGQPAGADQTNPSLDPLFERLKSAADPMEAYSLERRIWGIWIHAGDKSVNSRMADGIRLMHGGDFTGSLTAFDGVVRMAPGHAEGWNKRATVHYLMGDFDASVRDIQKTLELEPRHFGALSGMGLIYSALGKDAAALKVYQRVLEIHPQQFGLADRVRELKRKVKGSEI